MAHTSLEKTSVTDEQITKSAHHVLTAEAAALNALAGQLGPAFIKAVRLLLACKGRVVISGMGKSGHVARKIAATMASTGTPALFVHPGEASHGDLGMVVDGDMVIAMSNSGETAELTDLVAYTRRFSIPLIAITSRAQSALGGAADVTLVLPPEPEVCPMGLAPTTSTTMMLALGDALAVTALDCKGFTAEDFRNFHPGGKLGKILSRVRELMRAGDDLPINKASDPMSKVLMVITEKRVGCTAVVDDSGKLIGIITDGDLRRHMSDQLMQKTAADLMNRNPMTIGPSMLAAEAIKILNENKRNQLLVAEDGVPVGVLHIHDLLQAGIA